MAISYKNLGNNGRCGNQLFQIAATICLADIGNDKYLFPPWKYEPYFNLHNCFSNNIINNKTIYENTFTYQAIKYEPNIDLSGYFQSYKYITNEILIKNLLTPINLFSIKQNTCGLHVRRGDYLNLKDCHPTQPMTYYQQAMNLIKSKYYFIVSDDIGWCRQNFIGPQFIFSDGKSEIEDLKHLIACEHVIMANSSFSWWGSYLNQNSNKQIIYPVNWFGPKLAHDIKDLCPPTWSKI